MLLLIPAYCILTPSSLPTINSAPLEVVAGDMVRLRCNISGSIYRYVSAVDLSLDIPGDGGRAEGRQKCKMEVN